MGRNRKSDGGRGRPHRYGRARLLPDCYSQANIRHCSWHGNSSPVHALHMVAAEEF